MSSLPEGYRIARGGQFLGVVRPDGSLVRVESEGPGSMPVPATITIPANRPPLSLFAMAMQGLYQLAEEDAERGGVL